MAKKHKSDPSEEELREALGIEEARAPLAKHLRELHWRLMISIGAFILATALCYFFAEDIYLFLVQPLADIYKDHPDKRLIYTGLTEAFFTYMKLAMFGGLVTSFPILAAQLYLFLAPGLYKREKKVLIPYLVAAPLLFLMGAALAYYFIFPMAWSFFAGFEIPSGGDHLAIELEARVSEYLSLVMSLICAFGLAFQLPIILTLLARIGVIESALLRRRRKFAIVLTFIVAAILTPPDVISQIGLAIPLLLLYEISILACQRIEHARS